MKKKNKRLSVKRSQFLWVHIQTRSRVHRLNVITRLINLIHHTPIWIHIFHRSTLFSLLLNTLMLSRFTAWAKMNNRIPFCYKNKFSSTNIARKWRINSNVGCANSKRICEKNALFSLGWMLRKSHTRNRNQYAHIIGSLIYLNMHMTYWSQIYIRQSNK